MIFCVRTYLHLPPEEHIAAARHRQQKSLSPCLVVANSLFLSRSVWPPRHHTTNLSHIFLLTCAIFLLVGAVATFDDAVTTENLTMDDKFRGAADVGDYVVFAPYNSNAIGSYNTQTGTFDASINTGSLAMDSKFAGAAAADRSTFVVFAPYNADAVGIYTIPTDGSESGTFDTTISTESLTMNAKFFGAAVVGFVVVFAPCNANVVGTYNT